MYAKSFQDLAVYKLSAELAKNIFELSRKFPSEEPIDYQTDITDY